MKEVEEGIIQMRTFFLELKTSISHGEMAWVMLLNLQFLVRTFRTFATTAYFLSAAAPAVLVTLPFLLGPDHLIGIWKFKHVN